MKTLDGDAIAERSQMLGGVGVAMLQEARAMARRAADAGDDGTNDLLVSDVIRQNEQQVWFLAEHVVDVPLARA